MTSSAPRSSPAQGEPSAVADRVAPQLGDLMAQARRAAALPAWTRGIKARQHGDYRAPVKGRGMEYAESRPYQAGDDVRALDWRLTARIGRPHTKLFREERERPVYLCVDLRAAMAFATHGVFKSVQAARAAALLAWKATQNGDRVGGLVFSDDLHHELEPARGNLATARLLKRLVECGAPPAGHTRLSGTETDPAVTALRRLRRLVKPGSLVFVITDGRGFSDDVIANLTALTRHNDVGLLLVYDEFEARLPALTSPLKLTDLRGEFTLPAADRAAQAAYAARHETLVASISRTCRDYRALFATLSTTGDPLTGLQRLIGDRA